MEQPQARERARKPRPARIGRPPAGAARNGGTREALLAAAAAEFARHGFAGARVDRVCRAAGTTVRMVYHYFGSKVGLYVAVLEDAMAKLRAAELQIKLDGTRPLEGLLQLYDFIHDHFEASPQLVALLSAENLMQARYLKQSKAIPAMSSPVPELIRALVARGIADGSLARGIDPLRLYVMMVALSYFHLSNVHTLSAIFDEDLTTADWRKRQKRDSRVMIERYLREG